ncbi:MAG TPA: hypothetical protein PKZ16_02020 [bacterium]|nr:hypothetical protein [bacterium]HPL95851.1 hypothetical protein [bacterium]
MRHRDYKKPIELVSPKQRVAARRSEKIKHYGKVFLFFLIIIIIISLIYLFLFSPVFKIKKIIINGTDKAEEVGQIEKMTADYMAQRWFIFSQKNLFVFKSTRFVNLLKQKFVVKEITINKKRPNILIINLTKQKPVLIWRSGNNFFTVLENGYLFQPVNNLVDYVLPIVTSESTSTDILWQKEYINTKQIEFINNVFKLLPFYLKEIKIKEFVLSEDKNSRDIKVITERGWWLLFSFDSVPEEVLTSLKTAFESEIGRTGGLQYVDLRIKDKIYYK